MEAFSNLKLFSWFKKNRRRLPWREDNNPYFVWISEIMLQQTQVKSVLVYFERWTTAYPTLQDLSKAREEELLLLWQGLGYYQRVKNVLKTARILVEQETFPSTYEELLKLPGIGDYTASAILAFAFNKPAVVLDGNVERVLARHYGVTQTVKTPQTRRLLRGLSQGQLPQGKSHLYNEALMELGALVCLPQNPQCDVCPLADTCVSFEKGWTETLPVVPPKKKITTIYRLVWVICHGEKILLRKVEGKRLYENFWECFYEDFSSLSHRQQRMEELSQRDKKKAGVLGLRFNGFTPGPAFYHHYTRYKVDVQVCAVRLSRKQNPEGWTWVEESQLAKYPMTGSFQKWLLSTPPPVGKNF